MNPLTRKIRNKGYTLNEFCELIGISLRTYRRRENPDNAKHQVLVDDVIMLLDKRFINLSVGDKIPLQGKVFTVTKVDNGGDIINPLEGKG